MNTATTAQQKAGYRLVEGATAYKVGEDGSLWSRMTTSWRNRDRRADHWHRLKGKRVKSGHIRVTLTMDDRSLRKTFVHVVVLEAFVGPCPDGLECRHLDGNPENNRLTNLCWGTRLENVDDARRHGTLCVGSRNGNAKLNDPRAELVRKLRADGLTQRAIAVAVGVSQPTVNAVLTGKRWAS